ncbi:MAG: aromatic ring-hydroxylating dioxygenase subunit alpha [Alphaproteobacteria bacterium]|nr:aromatic ring-hydroxylating dioxygenase subunit alpha [Alphaproteobacteria bacterium]
MYLRNAWYVAAWDHELDAGLVARTFLDEPVVLYRAGDGKPVALEDRCCHRSMPLSLGKRVGDNLQCGYHGLVFDPSGRCVEVPGQTAVPPGGRIRSFPVVERWKWIWIWMGDPALADPDLIPNWWWMSSPDWQVVKGPVLHIKCNYQLINDNLLDLSHTTFVHADTIGNEAVAEQPVKTERIKDGARMTRQIIDCPPPPLYAKHLWFKGNVDRWQIVDATAPSYCDVWIGCAHAGQGATPENAPNNAKDTAEFHALSIGTPETARSTYQFYAHARQFMLTSAEIDMVYKRDFLRVFQEDVVIMEAQQDRMDRATDLKWIDINVDAPGLAMRKALLDLITAEEAGPERRRA